MKLHSIPFEDIFIYPDRQRKDMSQSAIIELASSITQVGLIHPIVVRKDDQDRTALVAGERRLRAMEYIWNFGQGIRCAEYTLPPNIVPCLYHGEIDPVLAYEIELEENARRLNLSWQEHAFAVARLAELKRQITGEQPSNVELAEAIGLAVPKSGGGGDAAIGIRQDLILARFLPTDPDVAKASSRTEAFKLLKRKEELAKSAEIGRAIADTLAGSHRLIKGNCLDILPTLPEASFDVICTDPPYGMGADQFGDSGGTGGAIGEHFYDDSPENFRQNAMDWIRAIKRVCKPQCHVYWFCDIEWFEWLKTAWRMPIKGEESPTWNIFRTPLIWHNPGGSRAPWPQHGPQRKSQYILFANKGNRPVTQLLGDVLVHGSDANLNHPAQKPVALYADLLRRSVRAGDSVLDPFAGTGPVFSAGHGLKCRVTAIEQNEAACGIAAGRLKELK